MSKQKPKLKPEKAEEMLLLWRRNGFAVGGGVF
jgi:hypothetical protein